MAVGAGVASAGSAAVARGNRATAIRTVAWDARGCREVPAAVAPAAWRERSAPLWIDATAPAAGDLAALAEALDLPPLAAKRAAETKPRPRLDVLERYVVLVLYAARAGTGGPLVPPFGPTPGGLAALDELVLIIGDGVVLTVHPRPSPLLHGIAAWWHDSAAMHGADPGALVRAIFERTMESFLPLFDVLADEIERLQRFAVLGRGESDQVGSARLRSLMHLKKELLGLRRILRAQREALMVLARQGIWVNGRALPVAFQDVFDRAVRVDEAVQTYHEMLVRTRETYLSRVSNELNVAAQNLLVFTCLLLVPTLVTGWYAMRFPGMPEHTWATGVLWPLAASLGLDGLLFGYFRARRWI